MSQNNKEKDAIQTKEAQPVGMPESQTNVQSVNTEVMSIIESLPEEQRKIILSAIAVQHFEGPIPPASMMREYEDILPGSCDRILKMAEKEQDVRHEIRKKTVYSENIRKHIGLIAGVIIVLAVLYATYDLAMKGHEGVAITLGSVTIIGLATIFVLSKEPSKNKKE